MSFLNEVLGAGGGSGLKFESVGTTHTGVITDAPKSVQQNDFKTKLPAFWDEAKTQPKMQAVINLKTDQRDPSDPTDEGGRTLYAASSQQKKAIVEAVRASGAADIEVGGTLTVQYYADDPTSQNPQNPKKLYRAHYAPPAAGMAALGAVQAPAAAATPPPLNSAAQAQQAAWNAPAAPPAAAPNLANPQFQAAAAPTAALPAQFPPAAAVPADPWNPGTPPGLQQQAPDNPWPATQPAAPAAPPAAAPQLAGMPPQPYQAAPPQQATKPPANPGASSLTGLPIDVEDRLTQLAAIPGFTDEQILAALAPQGVTAEHLSIVKPS